MIRYLYYFPLTSISYLCNERDHTRCCRRYYSIEMNGKVKIYHENMLKKYHTRMTAEVSKLKVGIAELVECASVSMVVNSSPWVGILYCL